MNHFMAALVLATLVAILPGCSTTAPDGVTHENVQPPHPGRPSWL
ncbi:hypothetical protein SAMN05446635_9928 [Burkholderia sp. OK233]|nr:hypothetical protein SAMN05446635_9928 [Burkholderia sp. OK233]